MSNVSRNPAGTPIGGQFAAGTHAEATGIDLSDPADLPAPLKEYGLRTQNGAIYSLLDYDDIDGDNYDFDAPYQRGHTWDDDRKRNLIRSVLTGIPIGSITLSERKERETGWLVIVDGKQRVTALRDFHEDRLTVPGHWFTEDDLVDPSMRAEEVRFSDLSSRGQRGFTGSTISLSRFVPSQNADHTAKIDPEFADQAEADLYLLINTGGIDQTDEDLARAREIANS